MCWGVNGGCNVLLGGHSNVKITITRVANGPTQEKPQSKQLQVGHEGPSLMAPSSGAYMDALGGSRAWFSEVQHVGGLCGSGIHVINSCLHQIPVHLGEGSTWNLPPTLTVW